MFEILLYIAMLTMISLAITKFVFYEDKTWAEWGKAIKDRFMLWKDHRNDYDYKYSDEHKGKEDYYPGGIMEYIPDKTKFDITSAKKMKHIEKKDKADKDREAYLKVQQKISDGREQMIKKGKGIDDKDI